MGTGRIEAFSDGVIAVIITIMVLDFKIPADASWHALGALVPGLLVYALSFATIADFWINHHHTLAAAREPSATLMWSNLALLFAMSLVPFVTGWVASAHGSPLPVASYGVVMLAATLSLVVLGLVIAAQQPINSPARSTFRAFVRKGSVVAVCYALAIPLAYVSVVVSYTIFIAMPIFYILPMRIGGTD